jgi:hypothetical protein
MTMRVTDGHDISWFATYEPAGRGEGEAGGGAHPAVDWSVGRIVFVSTEGERRSWLCAEDAGAQVAAGTMPVRSLRHAFNGARAPCARKVRDRTL